MPLSSWLRRLPVVAVVGGSLLAGGLAALAVAAPAASPIDGSYVFNANGWAGTLAIDNAESGMPDVTMYYTERNSYEYLSGTWNPDNGTLTIARPLSGTVSQSYTLFLGNHIPGSPVFGGYFTESDTGTMRYGVLADNHLAPGTFRATTARPATVHTAVPANTVLPANTVAPAVTPAYDVPDWLFGLNEFDGNGWDGYLLFDPCYTPDTEMYYNALDNWEPIATHSYDAATDTLTMVRPLSYGGVTQTYTMYLGTHRLDDNMMFGGYFTQSDTPGLKFAAYATRDLSGGVGC
ncbi:MAG TPA: hypothetical protein VHW44_17015 [Pseudonocardiaceae bacterium]|jgi:hypothetical protein|nr:hypothetical protein [Pseudonocardiaceae bacterium]